MGEEFKKFLINTSIGSSVIRNQGNGIIKPIRETLNRYFWFDDFQDALVNNDGSLFSRYLDNLTKRLEGLPGIDKYGDLTGDVVKWGTARKCVNLLLRTCCYNGHFWEAYGIKSSDFAVDKHMQKLELPLDSYSIKGIKKQVLLFELDYPKKLFSGFSIIALDKEKSSIFQDLIDQISRIYGICKIDWDILFWKNDA